MFCGIGQAYFSGRRGQLFRRILQRPKAGESDEHWQSAQALYNDSVMVMAHDDFADDRALVDASVIREETDRPR